MATQLLPLGMGTPVDSGVYQSLMNAELTMTNAKVVPVTVLPFPTGSDLGVSLAFRIPETYVDTPALVIRGVINGTPASTFAVGVQQLGRADSEAVDTAYETEDTATNATWTGYADEDEYEISITLTPAAAYVAGDTVYLYVYRDDSADTTTWDFLLTGLFFSYADA